MTNPLALEREVEQRVRKVVGPGNHGLHTPHSSSEKSKFVKRALDTSGISVDHQLNQELSMRLASLASGPNPVLVSSGTAALHLALLSVGVTPGVEVLCPALSFVATANAILYCGARPKFVDVEVGSLGLCPGRVRQYLESALHNDDQFGPDHPDFPRAMVAVSVFGLLPRLDELEDISREFQIPLVIDAAGAFGSSIDDGSILYRGDVAITSFNGNKIVTSGAGGAVFSRNERILEKCRHISSVAKQSHDFEFIHDELGYNYRLPAINAALLLDQLENFPGILNRKRKLHDLYFEALSGLPVNLIFERQGTQSNYWLNSARLPTDSVAELCAYLNQRRLGVRPLWKPLPSLPHLQGYALGSSFEIAEELYRTTVSFPSSYHLVP